MTAPLSENARGWLLFLQAGITVNNELKGYWPDEGGEMCKTYLSVSEVRQFGMALLEVAEHLDALAQEHT